MNVHKEFERKFYAKIFSKFDGDDERETYADYALNTARKNYDLY